MFDSKDGEIKDEEAETMLQNRKWWHYVPRLLANLIRENKLASAVAAIWLPDTQRFFMGIEQYDYESTAATKGHGFSVLFFGLLCSQTGRIRTNFNCSNYEKFEESYPQLLGILNKLRCHGEVNWKTTVPWKFLTVLGQVLTVVSRRLLKPIHIPLGFFCNSLEVTS